MHMHIYIYMNMHICMYTFVTVTCMLCMRSAYTECDTQNWYAIRIPEKVVLIRLHQIRRTAYQLDPTLRLLTCTWHSAFQQKCLAAGGGCVTTVCARLCKLRKNTKGFSRECHCVRRRSGSLMMRTFQPTTRWQALSQHHIESDHQGLSRSWLLCKKPCSRINRINCINRQYELIFFRAEFRGCPEKWTMCDLCDFCDFCESRWADLALLRKRSTTIPENQEAIHSSQDI